MKSIFSYVFFAFPLSFVGIPLYIYLPEYYSSNFGISLASIGFVVLITRTFDTITDPLIGYISDKFTNYRKKIIIFSAFFLGLAFFSLFSPILKANYLLNFAVFSFFCYLFFSILTINHLALLGSFKNVVKASSFRETFTVFGLLFATILPSVLMLKFSQIKAFEIIGIFVFFSLVLCCYFFAKNFVQEVPQINAGKKENLYHIFKNKKVIMYFSALLLNSMAIATPSTLIIFYIKHFLNMEAYIGFFLITYFVSSILFIPFWNRIAKKMAINNIFMLGSVCSIAVFSLCYFVSPNNLMFYLLICVFSGAFFSIDLICPNVITANIINENNLQNLQTFVFSATHFISKISVAIVSGLLLIFLGTKTGENYTHYLHVFYTILPCFLKFASLMIFYYFTKI